MFNKGVKIKNLKPRELCMIALLVSVTVVLGYISGFLRIGNIAKFSISFISVYVAAAAFGPFVGAFVAVCADFISHIVNQTGAYLWQIALIELLYGIIFGVLFYREEIKEFAKKELFIRVFASVFIQLIINVFLKTYVLMSVGYAPSPYVVGMSVRIVGCVIMALIQFVVLIIAEKFICTFLRMIRNEDGVSSN